MVTGGVETATIQISQSSPCDAVCCTGQEPVSSGWDVCLLPSRHKETQKHSTKQPKCLFGQSGPEVGHNLCTSTTRMTAQTVHHTRTILCPESPQSPLLSSSKSFSKSKVQIQNSKESEAGNRVQNSRGQKHLYRAQTPNAQIQSQTAKTDPDNRVQNPEPENSIKLTELGVRFRRSRSSRYQKQVRQTDRFRSWEI